ncbi:MAG: hypothetical protein P0S95_05295 [Rhabdochlamydiaceae bacterium]|nr:hypothetical protein [Candidatus Amphrikana amoebophyrae]
MDDDEFLGIPLLDAQDLEVLMHRDAHFGGNFDVMLEYYEQKGVGVHPDFELNRIKQLKLQQDVSEDNLSELLMPMPDRQMVERSKKLYHDLRSIYEKGGEETVPRLISDLILSEEELPQDEIDKLVVFGKESTKLLLNLIASDNFYDPLFPGYGRSPIFAAKALALIQDETSIPFLFSALGQDNFFTDEEVIKALTSFGDKSKKFLVSRLTSKPYTKENENAIIALSSLEDDLDVALTAIAILEEEQVWQHEGFVNYLIFACSGLIEEKDRNRFKALLKREGLKKHLKNEIEVVINHWK